MIKRFNFALLLLVLLVSFVSAESCSIVERGDCDDNILMGLYSATNTHGELALQGNYDYVLCCDFGVGDLNCKGDNKIIGLSDETNAHAEKPSFDNYDYDVCYDNLSCVARESCGIIEMEILTLSADTNAHIGGAGEYDTKICCTGICGEGKMYLYSEGDCVDNHMAYWADEDEEYITKIAVVPDYSEVKLILLNSASPEGTVISFDIKEKDAGFDDDIKTIATEVDSEGNAIATWLITEEYIEQAGTEETYDFYFNIDSEVLSSGNLELTVIDMEPCSLIESCMDYGEDECGIDVCSVASKSVEQNNDDVVCGSTGEELGCDVTISCGCYWNDNLSVCGPMYEIEYSGCSLEPTDRDTGTCFYEEDTADNCDDGFLTYSWLGVWEWNENNYFYFETDPGEDYVLVEENYYRFDPLDASGKRSSEKCADGSNSIPCPAQVELPFFNVYSTVITILVLIVIYYFINSNKKVRKKKSSRKRKKK